MRKKRERRGGQPKRGITDIEAPELGRDSLYEFPDAVIRRLLSGHHPLQVIREYRGLTQEHLADRLHVEASRLADIEADRLALVEELRLAAANELGVDPRALVRLVRGGQKLSVRQPASGGAALSDPPAPLQEIASASLKDSGSEESGSWSN